MTRQSLMFVLWIFPKDEEGVSASFCHRADMCQGLNAVGLSLNDQLLFDFHSVCWPYLRQNTDVVWITFQPIII